MATTVTGGAYLADDGVTWHDANGKVIEAPKGAGNKAKKTDAKDSTPVDPSAPVDPVPAKDK